MNSKDSIIMKKRETKFSKKNALLCRNLKQKLDNTVTLVYDSTRKMNSSKSRAVENAISHESSFVNFRPFTKPHDINKIKSLVSDLALSFQGKIDL